MSGCIPAVLNNTDGSFSGTSGALGTIACHLDAKNERYLERISADEMYIESNKKRSIVKSFFGAILPEGGVSAIISSRCSFQHLVVKDLIHIKNYRLCSR
jgi:hypothetical protein